MTITVFIRYQLDPFKRAQFEEYSKRWLSIVSETKRNQNHLQVRFCSLSPRHLRLKRALPQMHEAPNAGSCSIRAWWV